MSSINDFDDYMKAAKNISHPISGTVKIDEIKGSKKSLKIQNYFKNVKTEGKEIITILFVGQTGSGKSTMINGYLNFLLGITPSNDHRYKIVIGDSEKEKDQTKSQTSDITIYDVESLLYSGKIFRLIDTPGFGDTKNETMDINNLDKNKVDKLYFDKFENFFKEKLKNGKLNAVCFVVKSSESRENIYQKLIFETITNLFGKDVIKNFFSLFTFSDGEENPNSKQLMMKNYEIFKKKEDTNTPWYWCFNCQKYFCELKSRLEISFLETNIENFINFTQNVSQIEPIDSEMTQRNLSLKKELTSIKDSIKKEHLIPLLTDNDLLNKKLIKLNNQKAVVNEEKNNLKKLDESITNEQKVLTSKREYINQLHENVKEYDDKINKINSQLDLDKNNLSLMENEIKNLENQKKQENDEKEKLENEKKQTENKKKEIENNLEKLKNSNKSSEEIQELKRKLKESQDQIDQINKDVDNLTNKKNNIEEQINEAKRKKENIDNSIIQSKNEIDKMKKDQNDLLKQKNDLMGQYNELNCEGNEKTISDYENQIKKLEKERDEIKEEKEKYQESKIESSDQINLFCNSCKKNCCENCDCNWGVPLSKYKNWFCHKIGFFDKMCKVCDCHSDSHQRDKKKYVSYTRYNPKRIEKTYEEKKQINTHISILRNMIDNIKERISNRQSIDTKEKLFQSNLIQQKTIETNLNTKNNDKIKAESDIKDKNNTKQDLLKDVGSLSTQIEIKKKAEEEERKKKENLEKSKTENEEKISQSQVKIQQKEGSISSIEETIRTKEEIKRKEEENIKESGKQLKLNSELKKNHEREIIEQENEINDINNKISNLQIRKNELNILIQKKETQEKEIQNECNKKQGKKNDTQKLAFKQLIKIILLINEINNIQMENAKKKSMKEELDIILGEFEDKNIRDSVKNLINNEFNPIKIKLENNENQVLEEFSINKKSLLEIRTH